jgi:hypothetical protein
MAHLATIADHRFAAIPDFSASLPAPAAPRSPHSAVLAKIADAVRDLENAKLMHAGPAPADALALATAIAVASGRLAKAAVTLTDTATRPAGFSIVRGVTELDLMHAGRRIGFVTRPGLVSDRWSIFITLRLDEVLPGPLRFWLTKFDSLDAVKDFLSIRD